jgi:cobyrinic acid a,c-diamide synthase
MPLRAVRAHAGKNDADRLFAAALRQRREEVIDRQAVSALAHRRQHGEPLAVETQVAVGRDHVDAIGFDRHAIFDFAYLHAGDTLQQLGQHAFV